MIPGIVRVEHRPGMVAPSMLGAAPLPDWPVGWYVVGRSAEIEAGQCISGTIAGRSYVLFRGQDGILGALDAHCPHMGAHLGRGDVVGVRLRCPLHHWTIDRDGMCRGPGARADHDARTWPVAERFGLVFMHLGGATRPPVPAPEDPEAYRWTTGPPITLATDWRAMMINGFDLLHLRAVHHRALRGAPEIMRGPHALRIRYASQVTRGGGVADWVMRYASRDDIRIQQTCHGVIVVVETDLGRTRTAAVLGLLPDGGRVRAYGAFGVLEAEPFTAVRLRLARWLFTAFLRKDFRIVEGMDLRLDRVDDPGVDALAAFLRSRPDAARRLGAHR